MRAEWLVKNIYWQPTVKRWLHFQFNRKYQQAFLEDLAALIEDGVSASQAIDLIIRVTSGITKRVAEDIAVSIAKGQSLADGMQAWFSPTIVEVIRVGEANGALPQTLRGAANSYTSYGNAFNSFLSSTVYPLSVVVLALGISVFVKDSVLSGFLKIKPELEQWPAQGRFLYHIGTLVGSGWWLILLTLAVLILIVNNILKNVTGETRKWVDDIPLLSLYRSSLAARFMETLGLLLANGVMLRQALSTMQHEASPYLSWHLLQMEYHLSGGQENIADVLNTDLVSPSDLMRLRVVAASKGFAPALISLGRQARERTTKRIERTGKLVGALLLGIGAAIAMTIVFGIYTVGGWITL
jgi:type II secretory pathway component PulF